MSVAFSFVPVHVWSGHSLRLRSGQALSAAFDFEIFRVLHFSLPLREVGTLTFFPPRWISAIELGEGKNLFSGINQSIPGNSRCC
jgi:hypothetical protein